MLATDSPSRQDGSPSDLHDLHEMTPVMLAAGAAAQADARKRKRRRAAKELVLFSTMLFSLGVIIFGGVTGLVMACFTGASGQNGLAIGMLLGTLALTSVVIAVTIQGLRWLEAWTRR